MELFPRVYLAYFSESLGDSPMMTLVLNLQKALPSIHALLVFPVRAGAMTVNVRQVLGRGSFSSSFGVFITN